MKKLLVVFLALAMIFAFAATALAADTEIPDYTDLADQKAEWQSAVYRLTALGVLEGNNGVGGAFRPADYITRAELAKMVIYLTGNTDKVSYYASQAPAYTDVVDGFWAEGYINAAKDLGLMKGVGYGKFNPQGTVSFQETATVVLRALGYTDALKGEWPSDYSRKAAEIDLTEYVDYIGPKAITRAELSSIFNEGLDKLMVSYIADSTAQGLAQVIALTAAQIAWYFDEDDYDQYGLGVDADGFAYNIFYTNDDDRTTNRDLLYYAFEATAGSVQFWDEGAGESGSDGKCLSEANAWGYDDFDDGELLLGYFDYYNNETYYSDAFEVASLYYIYGGGLPDLANMLGDVTINKDDEVLFVGLTSQKIKVNVWDDLGTNNNDTLDDGDKVTVGDSKYKVDLDCGEQLNDDILSETVDKEGGFGYLFVDEDDHVYDYKEYQQFQNAGVYAFKSLDDKYINFVNGVSWRISKLPDYALIKDGEFAELADLEFGDVLYQAELLFGDPDIMLFIALSPTEGGDLTKSYEDAHFGFTVDGTRYYGGDHSYYSLDGGESYKPYIASTELRDEFFEEAVTYAAAYAWRYFVYVSIDVESYNYGVLTELDYKAYTQDENILIGVTILMADGTEVEYPLEEAYDNWYGPDNEMKWTLGSLVEFQLNKDGEIQALGDYGDSPDMAFLNNSEPIHWWEGVIPPSAEDQFTSRLTYFDVFSDTTVEVDEDDSTLEFDGETYTLADDAEIFVISLDSDFDYDECDIVTAADLLADGDFEAYQIAACYTSGLYDDVIDTLWIVEQDLVDDVKMGYQNGSRYRADGDFFGKLNDTTDVSLGEDAYDNWPGGDFVAYQLDGDTIADTEILINFNAAAGIWLPGGSVTDFFAMEGSDIDVPAGLQSYFDDDTDLLADFTLEGDDDVYSITVGRVAADGPDISKGTIKLVGDIFNGDDEDTYKYGTASFVFFKDFTSDEYDDMDELEAGDYVVLVRQGAKVLYAFHIGLPI